MQTEQLTQLSQPVQTETNSLLSKYGIPITHLDYDYIRKCENAKELEKIVLVLRSNEEGYFPHLTEVAEQKLQELKPKSKLLTRNVCVVNTRDLNATDKEEIRMDLQEFVQKMSEFDSELVQRGKCGMATSEIRRMKEVKEGGDKKHVSNRIKSTDYASWDRYDVDTECLKMDLEEKKLKEAVKEKEEKKAVVKPRKEFSTQAEAEFEANREKIKGNEFYKNSDYEQAIEHYTNSIEIKPISTTYTNRAIANIKLKNYGFAIDDCKSALKLDESNIKAYVRLAEIYEFLNKHVEAIENIDNALILDPNNVAVQNIAARLEKYRTSTKKLRFKIQCATNEKKKTECEIPIPGTSRMGPPFYVVGTSNNNQLITKKRQLLLHFINADYDLDGDDCTVNHLENRCSKKEKIRAVDCKTAIFNAIALKNKQDNVCENGSGDSNQIKHVVVDIEKEEGFQENYFNFEINTPFAFLNAWNSASKDSSYKQKAMILKSININSFSKVIGSKLDSKMLTDILLCLRLHFLKPEHVNEIHAILTNLTEISRFSIIKLFLTKDDIENFATLIEYLNNHSNPLSNDIKKLYI